jgi:hypothetical protein
MPSPRLLAFETAPSSSRFSASIPNAFCVSESVGSFWMTRRRRERLAVADQVREHQVGFRDARFRERVLECQREVLGVEVGVYLEREGREPADLLELLRRVLRNALGNRDGRDEAE